MDNKKLIKIITAGIVILVVLTFAITFLQGKNSNKDGQMDNSESEVVPTKEVEFVVVRVLPSGFSPEEVTIKKGMIVRFTNPLEDKVTLKWEGEKQFTNEAVFEGNDIATTVFDTEGVYTFSKESNSSQVGRVVVK